nr:MAG TPA: cytochrome C6 [Caudoviricetes sp.]
MPAICYFFICHSYVATCNVCHFSGGFSRALIYTLSGLYPE